MQALLRRYTPSVPTTTNRAPSNAQNLSAHRPRQPSRRRSKARQLPARGGPASRPAPVRYSSATTSFRSIRTCGAACRSRSRMRSRSRSAKRWSAVRSAWSRPPTIPDFAVGDTVVGHARLAGVRPFRWRRPQQGRCDACADVGVPRRAGHAGRHRLVWPEQDLHAQGGRDGAGVGGQRGGRVGRGPTGEDRWLPCRRHRRRSREMRLCDLANSASMRASITGSTPTCAR